MQNNWFSTRHCFSVSCTTSRYLSKIISSWYAAHWLSFAVLIVYHLVSYQEGIVEVPSCNNGNCFSETDQSIGTTNYSFTNCKPFVKIKFYFYTSLICYNMIIQKIYIMLNLKSFFYLQDLIQDFRGHD